MTVLSELLAVRELLAVPERWTKGKVARDPNGEPTTPYSTDAVCWCLVGAVSKRRAYEALPALRAIVGDSILSSFNDRPTTTHADILALLDRAIEAERAKETA